MVPCRRQAATPRIPRQNRTRLVAGLQEKGEADAAHAQQLLGVEAAAAAKVAAAEVDCQAKLLAEIERYRVRSQFGMLRHDQQWFC